MEQFIAFFIVAAMIVIPDKVNSQVKIDLNKKVITIDGNAKKANKKETVKESQQNKENQTKQANQQNQKSQSSERRGASVKEELVKVFSIDAARLESDGMGETQPVASNDTPVNKALNRRVELIKL